jgi:uncharacterized protein (DUF2267 family)
LRGRLTPDEAADVEAQLPAALKMLWSFDYPSRNVRRVHEYRFLDEVGRMLGIEDLRSAKDAAVAVFGVLQLALGSSSGREGDARHVFSQLPADLRELWLRAGNQNRASEPDVTARMRASRNQRQAN